MNLKVKKIKITKDIIPSLTIQFFYLLYFIRMIIGASTIYGILIYGLMSFIGITSLLFILFSKKVINKTKIILFITLFFCSGILSSMYTGNYRIQDYIIMIQYFGITILLYKYKLNFMIMKLFFIFYALFFGMKMITGVSPDAIFLGFSRNNITIFFLLQAVLLYIAMYQNRLKIKLYPSIILFAFSFWTVGRSGIFVSLLLLLLILIYIQFESGKKNLKIIYLSIILFILYSLISFFFYDELIRPALDRLFRLGFTDSHRGGIINEYFSHFKISFSTLLFGVPINQNLLFSIYGYNLHNSFLRLHAYHGLLGFSLVAFFGVKTVNRFLFRKKWLYLILFVIILMRASTDIAAFHGPFDPLIYYFIFQAIGKNN